MVDIAVVDYGMGNLRSVFQAVRKVAPSATVSVTDDPRVIENAGRVIFPGQGAMPDCMRELDARNLRQPVLDSARNKPFLGICIGLQMLFDHSAEGNVPGLGLLTGEVQRFPTELKDVQGNKLKVPHMGWNQVNHKNHVLWNGVDQNSRFYFVHSYYVKPRDEMIVQATSDYPQAFVCAVAQDNLFAVQFHPEKSASAVLTLLQNFVNWNPV